MYPWKSRLLVGPDSHCFATYTTRRKKLFEQIYSQHLPWKVDGFAGNVRFSYAIFFGIEDSWRGLPALSTSPPSNRDYWSNTFSSVLNSTSKLANNASYLWGSHSIWTPQTQSPNRVRRTPPGFDEQIQKKKRAEVRITPLSFSH